MAGSQKIFLRIVGLVGDREDADKHPDRLLVSGRGRLVPTIALGTADVRRGPDNLHEITLVEPVAFNIVNGMLTYNGDPYVWLPVPTGQWVWRIEFDEVIVDGRLRELDGYSFPLTPATPEQMDDSAYPGVNIAQYSLGTWAPGTVNLTAEAIGQITIMLSQASSSAAGASDSAAGASDSAEAAARSATAAAGSASAAAGSAQDAASSAGAAAGSATAAAGSAQDAGGSAAGAESARSGAEDARDAAVVAQSGAESARSGAESARDAAEGHASVAEQWATSFDVTASSSTLAPGSQATVTVTGDGPAYQLAFGVPQGEQGPRGPAGAQEIGWTDDGTPYLLEPGTGEPATQSGEIVAAGRPDISATMDGDTRAAVNAAPTGAMFRSTDGPQGAWVWAKRPTGWVVTDGDTGWIGLSHSSLSKPVQIARVGNNLHVSIANASNTASGTISMTLPNGFRLSKARTDTAGGPIVDDNGGGVGKATFWDGSLLQLKFSATGGPRGFTLVQPGIIDPWPTTLPGTPA